MLPLLFLVFSSLLLSSSAFTFPTFTPDLTPSALATCGIGSYDFSSLTSTSDWVGLSPDYSEIYYLSLCHTVQNLWCTLNDNSAHSQVCQVSSGDTSSTYSLMSDDQSATEWSYINGKDASEGIQFKSETGEPSGGCPQGGKRRTVGNLVCGNTTGVISDIEEGPQCTYTLTIPTATVCQKGQEPMHHQQADKVRMEVHKRLSKPQAL